MPVKTGIPWRLFIMADTRSVNRRAGLRFRLLRRPSTGLPAPFHRPSIAFAPLLHHPSTLLALKALRAMGAAMSLSLVAEHGR